MARDHLPALLDSLGYRDFPDSLRQAGEQVSARHPYAAELNAVLFGDEPDRVLGVYEVDGVPSVCLIGGEPGEQPATFDRLRAQLWNQGLISLVLVIGKRDVQAWPVAPKASAATLVPGTTVDRSSPYSAYGVRSGALRAMHPDWFDPKVRVDRVLLRNLRLAVDALDGNRGADRRLDAQHLMAQVLFVSYLEDRQLIPAQFLRKHELHTFDQLLGERDRAGLARLFEVLKERFNGDFLAPTRSKLSWRSLENRDFDTIKRFRDREDLDSTQRSLWRYDFRFLPVELLSSIYESFLADRQKKDGAYYTPRHLANLAVDEAFKGIERPDEQIVWDGACGSGILLTTAFRRMLNIAQAAAGHPLTLAERSRLLVGHLFGGDINEAACKIAAFSLYLCLLEDLPEPPRTKLPELIGRNLFAGAAQGDIFSRRHPIVARTAPRPTIMLSNPPWREPDAKDQQLTFQAWANDPTDPIKVPLKQIATAYALRAAQLLEPGGRVCLIMPAGAFVRQQHREFLEQWLQRVRVRRLINFSDLRMLLFPGAKHPCMVVVAERPAAGTDLSPKIFDYLTPKADLGLLYNRLTLHASDYRRLPQSQLLVNPHAVQALYWGSERELADMERQRLQGTFASVIKQLGGESGSGFHATDGDKAVDPGILRSMPHIAAPGLPKHGPALASASLISWPDEIKHVASEGRIELYRGPRIVVPNGMTPDHRIRAFAVEAPASCSNSCSVLQLGDASFPLARFAAAYLCSHLGAYFALLLAPAGVMERTQIKHGELATLPFRLPAQHSDPLRAAGIVEQVAQWVEGQEAGLLSSPSQDLPGEIESLIHDYFELSPTMRQIVNETAVFVLPSVQPTTIDNLPSPLRSAPTKDELRRYAASLVTELERSREQLSGQGTFEAVVDFYRPGLLEGLGLVTIRARTDATHVEPCARPRSVDALLDDLRSQGLLSGVIDGGVAIRGDILVQHGDTIFFAKPLVRRLWLTTSALDDALKIVRHVHATAPHDASAAA